MSWNNKEEIKTIHIYAGLNHWYRKRCHTSWH